MDRRIKIAVELVLDLVWFSALIALFAYVHHNPPQSSVLEFIVDAVLFLALLAGFSLIHYRAIRHHPSSAKLDSH